VCFDVEAGGDLREAGPLLFHGLENAGCGNLPVVIAGEPLQHDVQEICESRRSRRASRPEQSYRNHGAQPVIDIGDRLRELFGNVLRPATSLGHHAGIEHAQGV
jgi:hypothetical protein